VDYASNMLELIRRGLGSGASTNSLIATPTPATQVGSSLVVVGWFAGGALELTEYSALIHDYYVREAATHSKSATRHEPVHLIVDTRLTNSRLNIQAFVRRPMGLPGSKNQGSLFAPVRVVVAADDSAAGSLGNGIGERSILHFLGNCMRNTSDPMNCLVPLPSRPELQTLVQGVQQLHGMLERLVTFAEAAANGNGPADAATGRAVAALLARLSRLQSAPLEEALSTNVKDLLMLVYLADLLRSQLSIHERLVLT
jgi:translation initiation factor 3 subunit F